MILYVENPEDSQKIETANRWIQQSARYNINIQKNQFHFYTLAMNNPKRKLWKQFQVYNNIKKDKIIRNKFNQGGEKLIHWNL